MYILCRFVLYIFDLRARSSNRLFEKIQKMSIDQHYRTTKITILYFSVTANKLYKVQVGENIEKNTKVRYFKWRS